MYNEQWGPTGRFRIRNTFSAKPTRRTPLFIVHYTLYIF